MTRVHGDEQKPRLVYRQNTTATIRQSVFQRAVNWRPFSFNCPYIFSNTTYCRRAVYKKDPKFVMSEISKWHCLKMYCLGKKGLSYSKQINIHRKKECRSYYTLMCSYSSGIFASTPSAVDSTLIYSTIEQDKVACAFHALYSGGGNVPGNPVAFVGLRRSVSCSFSPVCAVVFNELVGFLSSFVQWNLHVILAWALDFLMGRSVAGDIREKH